MRVNLLVTVVCLVLTAGGKAQESSSESLAAQLVGSWDLVAYDRRDESGTIVETYYGDDPLGNLVCTASGDMSVHLVDPRLANFESGDFFKGHPCRNQKSIRRLLRLFRYVHS